LEIREVGLVLEETFRGHVGVKFGCKKKEKKESEVRESIR
jgi:hypothetical protein